MSDNNSTKTIEILLSILIGAFFTYIILKNRQQTTTQYQQPIQPIQFQPTDISLQEIKTQFQQMNDQLKQININAQLQQMNDQLKQTNIEKRPSTQPKISDINKDIQVPIYNDTLYKNNEKWKIIRNERGLIEEINVLRDVKNPNFKKSRDDK